MTGLLALALALGAPAQQPAPPKIELNPPVTLAFAGVKVALPKDYLLETTSDRFNLLRAVKMENDEPAMSISLSAFVHPASLTLDSFVDRAKPKPSLVLRNLRFLKARTLKMAGLDGRIRILTYEFRGVQTTAVMVFLMRPLASVPGQMGYVIVVEGRKERGKQLLPVLAAVGETLEFSEPGRPVAEPIREFGATIESQQWGYAIRPPLWWKAVTSRQRNQVRMFQTDYHLNAPLPEANLVVMPETSSAEVCAKLALKKVQEELAARKQEFQIAQEGPARLGGEDGYQFILRRELSPVEQERMKSKDPATIIQRTVCANGLSYSLLLLTQLATIEQAVAAMDALSSAVELSNPVSTATAPAPPPTTAPVVGPTPAPVIVPVEPPSTAPQGIIVPRYE